MSEVRQLRQEVRLAEQESSLENKAESKVYAQSGDMGSGDMGRMQRCSFPLQWENKCSQSSAEVAAGQKQGQKTQSFQIYLWQKAV